MHVHVWMLCANSISVYVCMNVCMQYVCTYELYDAYACMHVVRELDQCVFLYECMLYACTYELHVCSVV